MAGQLPEKNMHQLESWIGTGPKIFTLLYKITKDGCDATTFHKKCDNQGPTVTVLYNQHCSVYGGYASMNWNSADAYIYDGHAFLFQLKYSGSDKYAKFPVLLAPYGLFGKSNYGPTFGGEHDLYTYNGNITSSGGSFPFNGYMKIGQSNFYNNMGLTADQINNGTMAVIEMEVYRVTGYCFMIKYGELTLT